MRLAWAVRHFEVARPQLKVCFKGVLSNKDLSRF
jgi:hypothetical protein